MRDMAWHSVLLRDSKLPRASLFIKKSQALPHFASLAAPHLVWYFSCMFHSKNRNHHCCVTVTAPAAAFPYRQIKIKDALPMTAADAQQAADTIKRPAL